MRQLTGEDVRAAVEQATTGVLMNEQHSEATGFVTDWDAVARQLSKQEPLAPKDYDPALGFDLASKLHDHLMTWGFTVPDSTLRTILLHPHFREHLAAPAVPAERGAVQRLTPDVLKAAIDWADEQVMTHPENNYMDRWREAVCYRLATLPPSPEGGPR